MQESQFQPLVNVVVVSISLFKVHLDIVVTFYWCWNNTGDRLCDHFKKAVETKKETEDQLNLLIVKLNETGLWAVYFSELLSYPIPWH